MILPPANAIDQLCDGFNLIPLRLEFGDNPERIHITPLHYLENNFLYTPLLEKGSQFSHPPFEKGWLGGI